MYAPANITPPEVARVAAKRRAEMAEHRDSRHALHALFVRVRPVESVGVETRAAFMHRHLTSPARLDA